MKNFSEILNRASQLGGPGPLPVFDEDLFKVPNFKTEMASDRFPEFNGGVTMRFPNFGDEIEIDRLTLLLGGTMVARISATFHVCLEAAPASWWRANEKSGQIEVAIDRIKDSAALVKVYQNFITWRDTFRVPMPGPAGQTPEPACPAPVPGSENPGKEPIRL